MSSESSLRETKLTSHGVMKQMRIHGWTWKTAGAVFGLYGGIAAALVGSVLTAVGWLTGPLWHGVLVQRDGTVLLFLTIPFLIFGAHCLDLMDQQDK